MNFKVCGIKDEAMLHQLDKMLVDYAGFCFDENRPDQDGFVIQSDTLRYATLNLMKVGVFQDQRTDFMEHIMEEYGLNMIQFNGKESVKTCRQFSQQFELIKRINMDVPITKSIQEQMHLFDEACDYFLFDVQSSSKQVIFDQVFPQLHIEKPFFIGGDLKPSDAGFFHQFQHPDFFGLDLGTCFLQTDGKPDTARIITFMRAVNQVDN
jgi:phosphoribosylanthranilate isomerase